MQVLLQKILGRFWSKIYLQNASKQIKQTHAIKQDLLKRVTKSVGVACFYSKGLK